MAELINAILIRKSEEFNLQWPLSVLLRGRVGQTCGCGHRAASGRVLAPSPARCVAWRASCLPSPVWCSYSETWECMLSLQSSLTLSDLMDCVDRQAPLSMGFSRQEYWSGLLCLSPGDLPHSGIEPMSLMSPALAGAGVNSQLPVTLTKPWENHHGKRIKAKYSNTA